MSAPPPPPPPTRNTPTAPKAVTPMAKPGWKDRAKGWGLKGVEKGFVVSDWAGGHLNNLAEKTGNEHFYPISGDFPHEIEKCTRILRAFTIEGLEVKSEETSAIHKQQKVLRKIPPAVIKGACGLVIFTSMRSGIAPFGGAGGGGVVVSRLPDGTWSGPCAITPNALSTGLLLGLDIYDCCLVIRSQKALETFMSHKVTLGTDIGVAAGKFGAGAAVEMGIDKTPVYSYVRTRGLYVGIQVVAQVFIHRDEENERVYCWPGVKPVDILTGKAKVPREAAALHQALQDAESGKAQGQNLDLVVAPPGSSDLPLYSQLDSLNLNDGEKLRLPPTPSMTAESERRSFDRGLAYDPGESGMSRRGMEDLGHNQQGEQLVGIPVDLPPSFGNNEPSGPDGALSSDAHSEKERLRQEFAMESATHPSEASPSYTESSSHAPQIPSHPPPEFSSPSYTPPTNDVSRSVPPAPSYPPVLPPPSRSAGQSLSADPSSSHSPAPSLPARRRVPPPPSNLPGEGERKGEGVV